MYYEFQFFSLSFFILLFNFELKVKDGSLSYSLTKDFKSRVHVYRDLLSFY